MNRLELLPIELQEKIYYETHKLKFNISVYRIKNHFDEHLPAGAFKDMVLHLYSTGITDNEIKNYFEFIDWLDGKNLKITSDYFEDNVYKRIYTDFFVSIWDSDTL